MFYGPKLTFGFPFTKAKERPKALKLGHASTNEEFFNISIIYIYIYIISMYFTITNYFAPRGSQIKCPPRVNNHIQ